MADTGKKERDLALVEEFETVRAVTADGRSVRVPKSKFSGNLEVASANVLGGIKAEPKEATDTNEVKIDPNTGKLYCPPSEVAVATASKVGGIVAEPKTSEETQEVKIDPQTGKAYVKPSTGGGGDVTGVKGNAESSYRKGDVNITPANIGLGNVDNTPDSEKSVSYAETSGKAMQDGDGKNIAATYATKKQLETAEENSENAIAIANEAKSEASAALSSSNEAKSIANTAKNAVATLEGLSNTTEAQQILAAQVTQIESNKQDIILLNEKLKKNISYKEIVPSGSSTRYLIGAVLKKGVTYSVEVTYNSPTGKFANLKANDMNSGTATDTLLSGVYLNKGSKSIEYTPTEDVRYWYIDMASDYVKTDTTLVTISVSAPIDLNSLSSDVEKLESDFNNLFYAKISDSKNLCDPSAITAGYYLNVNGEAKSNANYSVTGYIPISEGQTLVCNASAVSSSAYHVWYDSNKQLIQVVVAERYGQSMAWVEGAAYVRFTTFNTKASELGGVQVELGTSSTSFEEYIPSDGSKKIRDEYLPDTFVGSESFEAFKTSGAVAQGGSIRLASNHVKKNSIVSACIKGTISSISFGLGYLNSSSSQYRDYDSMWIDLTSTQVKVYKSYSEDYQLKNTYTHGLTLTGYTMLEIDTTIANGVTSTKLRIFNGIGGLYEQAIVDGEGIPFVTNNGSSSLQITLSFFARDLVRKIWCFGDSYFSFSDSSRWPYYLTRYGFDSWLSNNQPGLKPQLASTELENLLSSGWKPVYVFWCLGMNGDTSESTDSNGNYVINSYQKTYLDKVVSICNEKGITLVLATIPTVPARQKTGYNNYVKSLGVRYVDFADAVGAKSDGTWNDGLLSSDGVHPSALGGKVLAAKVLVDFPEICIVE